MDAVSVEEIEASAEQEDSRTVLRRVIAARERQRRRYLGQPIYCNAQLDQRGIERYVKLENGAKQLLLQAVDRFSISMRTYGRIQKVALTIADLNGHDVISLADVAQAIQFRNLEGRYWK